MASINPEWNEFRKKNPDLRHDDDQRNDLFYASPAGQALANKVSVTNATIPARGEFQIPIRIYTAKGSRVCRGIVVFFHSGGFTGGSLETEDVSCRYMALNAPVTVISVEYRLSPAYKYPIPMNDGIDAFQYIASNVQQFIAQATEPVKLVLSGTSSGGHLAAIVSQNARNWFQMPQNGKLASQVQISGVLLRAPVTVNAVDGGTHVPPVYKILHQSWMMQYEGADLDRLSMTYNHDSLGVPANEKTSPEAYPLWGNLAGLPKTYIQICELDILRDDAVCYARGLQKAGVEVRQDFYEGLHHIFWIYGQDLGISKRAQDDCVRGLEWLLDNLEGGKDQVKHY